MNRWKIIPALLAVLSLLGVALYAAGIRPEHLAAIVALFAVSGMVAILYTIPQPAEGGNLPAMPKLSPIGWKILSIPAAALVGWLYAGVLGSGALAVATALIVWKLSGGKLALSASSSDERAEALKQGKTLYWASFLPEGVNVILISSWAYSLHSNPWIGLAIAAAFIGFVAIRVVSVPAAVNAFARSDWWRGFSMTGLALLTTVALLVATIFETVNDSGKVTDGKIEASDRAAQLDKDIEQARATLAGLSQYADAGQVQAEAEGIAKAEAGRQARIADLTGKISTALAENPTNEQGKRAAQSLSSLTAGCTNSSWYTKNRCGDVVKWRAELETVQAGGAAGGAYAEGHAQYKGAAAHLASLRAEREALGNGGESVRQAYRPDDRLVAEFAGIDILKAMWWKMIALGIFLDLVTLWGRFNSQQLLLVAGGDKRAEIKRKVAALVNYSEAWGIDLERILPGNLAGCAGTVAAASIQPAQVQRPEPLPALDTGGKVLADGGAFLHKDEVVLNRQAVEALEKLHPGLLDRANAGGLAAQSGGAVNTAAVYTPAVNTTAAVTDTAGVTTAAVNTAESSRPCAQCGKPFVVNQRTPWNKRFCSDDCRALGNGFPGIDAAKAAANRKRAGKRKA